jgi:hypothetical protein
LLPTVHYSWCRGEDSCSPVVFAPPSQPGCLAVALFNRFQSTGLASTTLRVPTLS